MVGAMNLDASDRPDAGGTLFGRVFAAVLFDMDGTLTDSAPSVERCWTLWGARRGLPREDVLLAHGIPARQILAMMVKDHEIDEQLAVIERMEIEDCAGVVPLPGAIAALSGVGPRAAIVTSCTRDLFLVRSLVAGLPVPKTVVTASDVELGKPDPAPYLLAARRLGVDPRSCLVVEDAPAGLAAGRAAGCSTLAVTTTHRRSELHADLTVGDLSELRFEVDGGDVVVRRAGV